MKKILVKTLLSFLATFSFSCGMISPIYADLFSDKGQEASLFLNGDKLDQRYAKDDTYEKYCILDDGSKAVERLTEGETIFILAGVGECSHCQQLQPHLCEILSYVSYEVFFFHAVFLSEAEPLKEAFRRVENAFPAIGAFPTKVPTAYLVSADKPYREISVSKYVNDTKGLAEYLCEFYSVSNIARFEKKEGFAEFLKKEGSVGYVYSTSSKEFIENEKPALSKAIKRVGILKSETLDEGYYKYENGLKKIEKEDALGILSIS